MNNQIFVFLSYGHDDYANQAECLYKELKKTSNLTVWWDGELSPSDDWYATIDSQLNELIHKKPNSCFIFVVSPYSTNTIRDNFCIKEIIKALMGGVRIIPIKIVDCTMPLILGNIQWMDFSDFNKSENKLSSHIKLLRRIIKQKSDVPRDGKQSVLYRLLEPCSYALDFQKHINYVERPWLLNAVESFVYKSNQPIMLILGGPGTGKTAFAVRLSHSCSISEHIAAWHLCQYNDYRTGVLRNAVKSLVFFLSRSIKEYYDMLEPAMLERILNNTETDASTLFKALILEPINNIKKQRHNWVILIDALDEMSSENAQKFARMLASYATQLPNWLKIILTSRNDDRITTHLKANSTVIIDLDSDESIMSCKEDVERYVESKIAANSVQITKVAQKSGNNFLFAQLLCNDISNLNENDEINLPKGVNTYYVDYLNRYFQEKDFIEQAVPLLNILLTSYEPMKTEDIYRHLHSNSKYEWCNCRSAFEGLIQRLGSLLKNINGSLLPFHKSFSDWLLSNNRSIYQIDRGDGLEQMIEWGNNVVNSEFPDDSDLVIKHFYKYFPHYLLAGKRHQLFLQTFTDIKFWERRSQELGVDILLSSLFEELGMSTNDLRKRLFQSEKFFKVLYMFSIDLFNKGYYSNLKNLGYSVALGPNMSDEYRLLAIRYYYINELYEEIDKNLKYFIEPYKDDMIKSMVLNELGQTYRKFGELTKSADYYKESLGGNGECHMTYDDIIYTKLNLSRVLLQLGDHIGAKSSLNDAISIYKSNSWQDSFQGADYEFSSRQLERAVRYVVLETEILSSQKNDEICQRELDWADKLYSDIVKRDRYYTNHLLSKLLYLIRCNQSAEVAVLFDECKNNISCHYDQIRLSVISSLLSLGQGNTNLALQIASEQLFALKNEKVYSIQKTELLAIINHCQGTKNIKVMNDDMKGWYNQFMTIINQITENNQDSKELH